MGAAVGLLVGKVVVGVELGIPATSERVAVGFAVGMSASVSGVGISVVGAAIGLPGSTVGDSDVGLKYEGLNDGCEASANKESSWGLNIAGAAVKSPSVEEGLKDMGSNTVPALSFGRVGVCDGNIDCSSGLRIVGDPVGFPSSLKLGKMVGSPEKGATVSRFTYTSSTSPSVVTVRAKTMSMIPDSLPSSIPAKAPVMESLKRCVNSMKKDPSGTS